MPFVRRTLRRYGLWPAIVGYGLVATLILMLTMSAVSVLEVSTLYVRLVGVMTLLAFPLVLGLAWALREPPDPSGRGFVVRD